uniref:Uncharacterized protein n=1 Tax=Mus musculus TaxID=10090 RepID=Q3UT81_MOUSE|nr:unnamed protein product [Mus musculus]
MACRGGCTSSKGVMPGITVATLPLFCKMCIPSHLLFSILISGSFLCPEIVTETQPQKRSMFGDGLFYPYLFLHVSDCLSQGFYSCTNIMTKKQVGEESVYSAYNSILLFITKEVRTGSQAG